MVWLWFVVIMSALCIACNEEVRPRQQDVSCDGCGRSQHRTCNTGISLTSYRQHKKCGKDVFFLCAKCSEEDQTLMYDDGAPRVTGTRYDGPSDPEPTDPEPQVVNNTAALRLVMEYEDDSDEDEAVLNSSGDSGLPVLEETETNDDYVMDNSLDMGPPVLEASVPEAIRHLPEDLDVLNSSGDSGPPVLEATETNDDYVMDNSLDMGPPVLEASVPDAIRHLPEAYQEDILALHVTMMAWQSLADFQSPTRAPMAESTFHDALGDAHVSLNASFDISHREVHDREPVQEESMVDRTLTDSIIEDEPLMYTLIRNGSQRGSDLLVTNTGFAYGIKHRNTAGTRTSWRCNVRTKTTKCPATVSQRGDHFVTGSVDHTHAPYVGRELKARISTQVKKDAKEKVFRPAMTIVEDALLENVKDDDFVIPQSHLMKRVTNRARAKLRPDEPRTLDFEVDDTFLQLGEFLVADIRLDDHRHFIFATPHQLGLLKRAKRWYMDGTFKVLSDPYNTQSSQLMSIHAFVCQDGKAKQFPLAFCLMSRRTIPDYVQVLTKLKIKMGGVAVEEFVLDFETAAWTAVRRVFDGVHVKGCVFHWTQCLWRKIQAEGLATTYRKRQPTHEYLRSLMALPFLPAAHIRPTFNDLKTRATTGPLREVVNYIEGQWFENRVIDIPSWSIFRQTVRTNNDVEGWHHRLNRKAGMSGLGFYRIVPLLRREAELVEIAVRGGDLCRDRRQAATKMDTELEKLWEQYMDKELTTSRLLRRCGELYSVR